MMEKICVHCGHHNSDKAKFCQDCGTDLSSVVATPVAPPLVPVTPSGKSLKDRLKGKSWLMFLIGSALAFVWFIGSIFVGLILISLMQDETGRWITFGVTAVGTLVGAPIFGFLMNGVRGKNQLVGALINFGIGIIAILVSLVIPVTVLGNVLFWPGIVNLAVYAGLKKYANS